MKIITITKLWVLKYSSFSFDFTDQIVTSVTKIKKEQENLMLLLSSYIV